MFKTKEQILHLFGLELTKSFRSEEIETSRAFMMKLVLLLAIFDGCVSTSKINDDTPSSFRNGVKAFMDKLTPGLID